MEITKPSEVHVTNHQLIVEQEEAKFSIPLEDIEIIICIGAKIRFSTMGLGEITQAGIIVVGFGKKHETQTLIEPCRAMIDQAAFSIIGNDINLSTKQRRGLTGVLHKNCEIDGIIMQISNGIEIMVDSLKNSILQQNIELLKIPILLDL